MFRYEWQAFADAASVSSARAFLQAQVNAQNTAAAQA